MRALTTGVWFAATIVGLMACGESRPPEDRSPSADSGAAREVAQEATETSYRVIEVVDGGSVRGMVRYGGAVPPGRTVAVSEDTATCGTSREVNPVRVDSRGGLADAVVALVDIRQGKALVVSSPPTLDQRGCSFTPHILLAPTGTTVRVLNGDPITHNVHTAAFDNRSVNRTQPKGLEVVELRFDEPETVKVKCDLHPWMTAWIVATDHPYQAVTDESGEFVLSDIPPGTYRLQVWHEILGSQEQVVTITAGGTTDLNIEFTAGG